MFLNLHIFESQISHVMNQKVNKADVAHFKIFALSNNKKKPQGFHIISQTTLTLPKKNESLNLNGRKKNQSHINGIYCCVTKE